MKIRGSDYSNHNEWGVADMAMRQSRPEEIRYRQTKFTVRA